jgi:DinB family protein
MTGMTQTEREELIRRYEAAPARLRAALKAVPPEAMKWRPAEGKWSAHEIGWHCADSETAAAVRIRYVVAEKDTLVVGYDQDAWTRIFDYHALPLEPALVTVDAVHASTALVLHNLTDESWSRVARHSEHPTYGAEQWLKIYANHVENHSKQIERNMEAWSRR